jgi:hypothetical protein
VIEGLRWKQRGVDRGMLTCVVRSWVQCPAWTRLARRPTCCAVIWLCAGKVSWFRNLLRERLWGGSGGVLHLTCKMTNDGGLI